MKSLFIILFAILLGGCSVLEVEESLDYVNDSADLITTLNNFGNDAPQMLQKATADPQTRDELETQLISVVEELENFNSIDPPAIAEEVHQQLVAKNEVLLEEINSIMVNGEVLIDKLENSEIYNLINEITDLQNQLEELGV